MAKSVGLRDYLISLCARVNREGSGVKLLIRSSYGISNRNKLTVQSVCLDCVSGPSEIHFATI